MRKRSRLSTAGVLSVLLILSTLNTAGFSKGSEWDAHIEAGSQALARGDYMQASTELDAAMQCTAKFQAKDPRLARTYYEMGQLRSRQGDWNDAREYYKRALFIQQQTLPADSAEVGNTVYGLAVACEQTRDYQEAVIHLKRVYEIWSKLYGSSDPKLIEILASMATYATLDSDLATAEQCYRQIVSIQEKLGKKNRLGASLNLWAATLANAGKYKEAEPIAKRAVDLLSTGTDTPTSLDSAIVTLRYIEQQMGIKTPYIPPSVAQTIETPPAPRHTDTPATPEVKPTPIAEKPPEKPVAVKPADTKPPVVASTSGTESGAAAKPTPTATNKPVDVRPVDTKPVSVAVVPPTAKPPLPKTPEVPAKTDTKIEQTKVVMRPPTASTITTPADFRPWELQNSSHVASKQNDEDANWGKIRYLANGRLISAEQYKAMLLANEAYELIRAEKYLMSIDILQKALAIYPQMATGRSNLGLVLSQLGRYDEAIESLRDAISLDQSRPGAWLNLASAFQMSGRLKESIATYSEFVRRFPREPLAPKAGDLVKHLAHELQEQQSVKVASNDSDYFAYASHESKVRWPESKTNIKVFVSPGSSVNGFKSEYGGFFADSFKQWENASNHKVNFEFVKKPDGSDIECMWTDDLSKVSSPAEGGETRLSHDGKSISHAAITVLTSGPTADSPLSPSQVRAICLHEIGHALGLVGHSPKPTDVMYCSVPPASAKVGISPRDTTTIIRLYSGDAVGQLMRQLRIRASKHQRTIGNVG